ncbi:hypothetical protein CCO02nite_15200 [Cellulomonas composti]|uniref:Uncharacterized protein n=1 Tax=Cellulomonas composti TaxID=266130 RepID=A0A511JA56_9CELL|nr:hypothetical protein CCO02nite_15200 [Cellulomonas composti]
MPETVACVDLREQINLRVLLAHGRRFASRQDAESWTEPDGPVVGCDLVCERARRGARPRLRPRAMPPRA